MLISAHALLADATASPGSIQLSPSTGEIAPTMRVITQDEFDGKVPVVISLNESLIIPIHYQRHLLSNNVSFFFGPNNSDVINVIGTGATLSPDGTVFDINLVCTGKQTGQETAAFGEGGEIAKQFAIQVVE